MNYKYTLLLICILSVVNLNAAEVPLADAKQYAIAAFQLYATKAFTAKKSIGIDDYQIEKSNGKNLYYAFNISSGGFVVISAEDRYHAVLAFSEEGRINTKLDGVWGELSVHTKQIEIGRSAKLKSNAKIQSEWTKIRNLAAGKSVKKSLSFSPVVEPLTTTKWNQSGFYSESCPADTSGVDGNTYSGCLPIAAAQLMKYYKNDARGNGFVSYNDPIYGPQQVDLCGQNFDWTDMPDVLTEHNPNLADFIYDVGKSMQTHYSTSYTGTYVSRLRDALVYFYGFDKSMKSFYGTNPERYANVLKKEFDEGRIIFLSGWSVDSLYNAEIGHTWIADGYGYSDTGAEYMHFNWGWGGSNNGWFLDTKGFWVPHEDNPEQASVSYYWYRYTVYNIFPSGEDCQSPDLNVTVVDPADNYAWMYYRSPFDEEVRFRYREDGDQEWTDTDPTFETHTFAGQLKKGTNYEYQLSRNCCGSWSPFTESVEFLTEGVSPDGPVEETLDCTEEEAQSLFTSSISESFAYIYTSRPHGAVNNQFRFRVDGEGDWIESPINSSHFYTLRDLSAGTSYEFQVRHECSPGDWSTYSKSQKFTTTGTAEPESDCAVENTESLFTSSISDSFAYIYTSRPHGVVNNQFRYRVEGRNEWIESPISSSHFYALRNLSANTNYEYQVRHECSPGNWSDYSGSLSFATTGSN